MYSKELEELIDGALVDGVITDKERAVLYKKAEAEGVDPDELDMVLAGRLAKMRPTPPPQPVQSTKMGNVMKCPNCGAPYEPGTGKCSVCGHVFQNVEALKSSVKLAEGIQRLMDRAKGEELSEKEKEQICSYIKNFPLPTTKDDILDFMLSCKAKSTQDGGEICGAFDAKFRETVSKAKFIFANDPQVQAAVQEMTKFKWSNLTYMTKFWVVYGIMMVIGFIVYIVFVVFGKS